MGKRSIRNILERQEPTMVRDLVSIKQLKTIAVPQQMIPQTNSFNSELSNLVSAALMNHRRSESPVKKKKKLDEDDDEESDDNEGGTPAKKKTRNRSRKNFFDVSSRQQRRLTSRIKQDILQYTNDLLAPMGLSLKKLEVVPTDIFEGTMDLRIMDPRKEDEANQNRPTINNLLYYKDKFSISDKCYCDLKTKCFLPIPSLTQLKKRRVELDSLFEIFNNEMGVYVSFKEKLKMRLQCYFERKYGENVESDDALAKEGQVFRDHIIHIKLSADGTNIGRNLKLLNFTFTILNEGQRAKRATGNYTLGIYEIENESHAALTECFKEIIDELEQMNDIEVCGRKLKIVYYYGADWKMLAIILGLLGANSKYPCVWCKCPKEEFWCQDKDWSIIDANQGARSYEDRMAVLAESENKKKKDSQYTYCYTKPAIFRNLIPNSRYMIDMLHLFLRISDTLFNLLVKDCSLADNFDSQAIAKFDLIKYKHMNSLQHFLNEKCNVRFQFLWVCETKKLTWRDLVGPEKIKMFENLNLKEIIPDHEKLDAVESIWNDFYTIVQQVKDVEIDAVELKEKTREWLALYLTVYNKATVTPYMHAFVSHLPEFVHLYKDINAFNCQGLEKLNDLTTAQFFKGTNKQDTALHQMLKKRNRMEFLCAYTSDSKEMDQPEH